MRVTKQKAQENRDRIVATAASLFRERGFDGVGVADLMERAGFTHGGFYNHFRSKEELIGEATVKGFKELNERYQDIDAPTAIGLYISREHRDAPAQGCPAAALGGDAVRQPESVRSNFADGIEAMIAIIEKGLASAGRGETDLRATAMGIIAQAAGAIMLSRACPDSAPLADEILETCRTECFSLIEAARSRSIAG